MSSDYKSHGLLLKNFIKSLQDLRIAGIATNKKDFTSQVGEWLVAEIYGGSLALNSIQKDWDLIADGKHIQVKSHAKSDTNTNRKTRLQYDESSTIDELIIVIFTQDYMLKEFYSISWPEAYQLISHNKAGGEIYWNRLKDYKVNLDDLPNRHVVDLFL